MDSTLITSLVGAASFVWGCYQWRAGRRDTRQQQDAANVLNSREQTLEELREMAAQRKADYEHVVAERDASRVDAADLRRSLGDALAHIETLRRAVLDETVKAAGAHAAQQLRGVLDRTPTSPPP